MDIKIKVENEVKFNSEIVIQKPPYMSMKELYVHLGDAQRSLGETYSFKQLLVKLEDMGFDIKETATDFLTQRDLDKAEVLTAVKLEGDSY